MGDVKCWLSAVLQAWVIDPALRQITDIKESLCSLELDSLMKRFLNAAFRKQSVRLHAQLSRVTAIVRLCCSIRQLQLSEYTCRWENRITGRSMSNPGMLGGAVPISTSGNRPTSGWPLYPNSCLGIWERCHAKSEAELHFCPFRIWCTW